ncbi:MAG: sodium:proton antiporter [Denitrovibrio sp.]|nr:MAG: sodium:proton antiporter [Denitrovibrio sp.]
MIIDFLLLMFLIVIAIAALQMKDILNSIMLLGAYSLYMALVWTYLDAVDVAFTEASVGAGITTVLMIAALTHTTRLEVKAKNGPYKRPLFSKILPLAVVLATGALLFYGSMDMPVFGDPTAPAHTHVAPEYIERAHHETGSYNIVTSILASYRGFDTLGETTVVFTAGICLILLLRRGAKK